ncbi:MAG: endolytic transglycosylase MltG, partial [Acidimicrobiia bacterium]|nr:endolytic transglycosylase MltG [Acidimicrobiia bacterium]
MTTDDRATGRRSRRQRIALVAVLAVLAVLGLVVVAISIAGMVGGTGVEAGQPVTVSIAPGAPASRIYRDLSDAGVVSYAALQDVVRAADAESRLRPGTYEFVTGMDPNEVLRLLTEGGTSPDSRAVTVVEGWTVTRVLERLAEVTEYDVADFETALVTGAVSSPLLPGPIDGVAPVQRWEGLLYPARYEIPVGLTPAAILQPMADEMVRRFESVDWSRLADTGLDRYSVLILASLVERESGTDADRPLISSVLYNRLSQGMRLQIDATVVYALGENPGRVLAEHLEVDSPYNT